MAPETAEVKGHIAWLERRPGFDLVLLMHEDCDEAGFYLNDFAFTGASPQVAEAILAAVSQVCPVDRESSIDGRPARDGITRPLLDSNFEGHWPESFFLHERGTPVGFNFESTSRLPLETRIAAHMAAVMTAVGTLPYSSLHSSR